MDKELRKTLETTWTGNLISVTPMPDHAKNGMTWEKANCTFLVQGGDMQYDTIHLEAFGFSAGDLKKLHAGDLVRISFITNSRYFEPKDMWFTKANLQSIELLDSGVQPSTEQQPADIYPAGNQLPTPPTMQGEAIKESDFDFTQPPA
jgi:hypothetical protein